ncbi:MAG TPA: ABC transporter substrate-binding protein, partial [Paracoccus sp.]|nr:ABC transporter substrate-binding protein [Paracoccus sp. (in: a-proteobacteria)]
MKRLISVLALTTALSTPAYAQVIGVSIPAATHGWAGGMNYAAQSAINRLETVYPDLEFVLATASDPAR